MLMRSSHVNVPLMLLSSQHILSTHPFTTLSPPFPPPPLPSRSPQAKERQIEEWSGAESPVSELMRALQDNRRLSTDLADAKAQLSSMDVFNSKSGTNHHPVLA